MVRLLELFGPSERKAADCQASTVPRAAYPFLTKRDSEDRWQRTGRKKSTTDPRAAGNARPTGICGPIPGQQKTPVQPCEGWQRGQFVTRIARSPSWADALERL
jgi:hypothetical protein